MSRLTKIEERLKEHSARDCYYVLDEQGPECKVEWPGRVDVWCAACFARHVLHPDPGEEA